MAYYKDLATLTAPAEDDYVFVMDVSATGAVSGPTGTAGTIKKLPLAEILLADNNLSDLGSAATARTNLGLAIGSAVQAHDADLDTIAALADPNADRLLFWDDSAGAYAYLTPGTGLAIAGTTLNATVGGGGGATVAATSSVLKGDGAGNGVAATAGTDYLAPGGSGAALTGITAGQVSGLGTAATTASTTYATAAQGTKADSALQPAGNLSGLADASVARTNLGLGTIATHPATDFAPVSISRTGLLAEYRFDEQSGGTLTDYSGNGRHGTLAGSPLPTWDGLGLRFGASAGTRVTLPVAVLATAQTILIASDMDTSRLVPNMYGPLLGNETASSNLHLLASANAGSFASPCLFGGGSFATVSGESMAGPIVVAATIDGSGATNDRIYLGGPEAVFYFAQGKSAAARGGVPCLGGGTTAPVQGLPATIYFVAFYSTLLSPGEVAAASQAIEAMLRSRGVIFGRVAATGVKPLVAIGDSLTSGQGATPWAAQLATTETFSVWNAGQSGITLQYMAAHAPGTVRPFYDALAGTNLCVLWGGTNDPLYGATAAQTFDRMRAACRRIRESGFKVIVATMISRVGADTFKNSLNALVVAHWPQFADGLADLGANAGIGADGACANTTYFQGDQTHLTTAGQAIVAGIISAAIDAIA